LAFTSKALAFASKKLYPIALRALDLFLNTLSFASKGFKHFVSKRS
jgi:hypothetical protein